MKYNILWFDDEEDYIDVHESALTDFLEKLGYEVIVTRKIDDSDLEETLKTSQADIILMDYRLPNAEGDENDPTLFGDAIIARIRDCDLFVETILYSRDPTFPANVTERLQGVFFATHTELPEKAKKIIKLTLKKQQEITNIRGAFIAEAIDIATEMEELIIKIMRIAPPVDLEMLRLKIMHSEFFNDYAKFKMLEEFFTSKEKILKEVVSSSQYETKDREKAKEILKVLTAKIYVFKQLEPNVINIRNQLAHSKPSPDNTGYVYKNKLVPLGEEICHTIRGNFRCQLKNIHEIAQMIDTILAIDYPPKKQAMPAPVNP